MGSSKKNLDARVAVEIMGLTQHRGRTDLFSAAGSGLFYTGKPEGRPRCPHIDFRPTTEAGADAMVLAHIRATRGGIAIAAFRIECEDRWWKRGKKGREGWLFYRPGDWSLSALAALAAARKATGGEAT